MPIFKIDEWLDSDHPKVKEYRQRAARQKIDKLTLDIVLAEKRHKRNLRIFDWVFKALCFGVIAYLIFQAAHIN